MISNPSSFNGNPSPDNPCIPSQANDIAYAANPEYFTMNEYSNVQAKPPSGSPAHMSVSQLHLQSIHEFSSRISYSNSTEYRQIFRKITHQSEQPPENPMGIDDETLDEQHYDDDTVSRFMDIVYHSTQDSPLFQQLYDSAAAKMISTDREIGLAVLFSYDYMSAFYTCYCDYMLYHETFSETTPSYMKIKSLL